MVLKSIKNGIENLIEKTMLNFVDLEAQMHLKIESKLINVFWLELGEGWRELVIHICDWIALKECFKRVFNVKLM